MNSNQFLQTARTVTFLIQKTKVQIPDFDSWYTANVLDPCAKDTVMKWARDSRNQIEKRGDLELNSSLDVALVISYDEEDDLLLEIPDPKFIMVGVKQLTRIARKHLPSGVSDSAIVKIERRWVTSSLKDWELLTALSYVYARMYEICVSLGGYLDYALDGSIPDPTSLDLVHTDARKTRYLKLRETGMGKLVYKRIEQDPEFVPPDSLVQLLDSFKEQGKVRSLEAAVERYELIARETFQRFGSHVPMLLLFDDEWNSIDMITTIPADQSEKYIFWRSMGDRILYEKPYALIYVYEAWIRKMERYPVRLTHNLPVRGEVLVVVGMDSGGNVVSKDMKIVRDAAQRKPRLLTIEDENSELKPSVWNFLIPARRAFEKLST